MSAPGMCECGCGQATRLAPVNDRSKGWTRGKPLRFVRGHGAVVAFRARGEAARGNRELSSHGYVVVNTGPGQRRYEHILVAEKALGRPLKSFGKGHPDSEVVHHIDGDKTNNAPSNLLICTHRYHTELHHRLEASPDWPEFPPIIRRGFGCGRKAAR